MVIRTTTASGLANSAALFDAANDTLTLTANRTYIIEAELFITALYASGPPAIGGVNWNFSNAPTSMAVSWVALNRTSGTSINYQGYSTSTTTVALSNTASATQSTWVTLKGILRTGATGGTMQPLAYTATGGMDLGAYSWMRFTDVSASSTTLISGSWA
jgi:hypothetical protein